MAGGGTPRHGGDGEKGNDPSNPGPHDHTIRRLRYDAATSAQATSGCGTAEPFPSWLCLVDLQYVDGLGELSGAPGAQRRLRRLCRVVSQCQSAGSRRPEISIGLRCEQAPARLPGPGKPGTTGASRVPVVSVG